MKRLLALLFPAFLWLAQTVPSEAWLVQAPAIAPTYTGVADVLSGITFGYSCTWAMDAAYTIGSNNACKLQRTSDSGTCTVLIATNGQADYTVGTPCSGSTVLNWATRGTFTGTASASTTMTTTGDACTALVGDQVTWTGIAISTFVTISTVTSCSAGVGSYVLSHSETFTTATVTDYIPVGVSIVYDQTAGNACASASCNLVQSTAADQPLITWNCLGTLVCLRLTSASIVLLSANNFTPNAAKEETLSVVVNEVTGTGNSVFFQATSTQNNISHFSGASEWHLIVGGSPCCTSSSAVSVDGNWHAGNAVMEAGTNADILNVDGTETTGTQTPSNTAAKPGVEGVSSTTFYWIEAWLWDDLIATNTQRNALCSNEATRNGLSLTC